MPSNGLTRHHIFLGRRDSNFTFHLVTLFATTTIHEGNLWMVLRQGLFITYLLIGINYYYATTQLGQKAT